MLQLKLELQLVSQSQRLRVHIASGHVLWSWSSVFVCQSVLMPVLACEVLGHTHMMTSVELGCIGLPFYIPCTIVTLHSCIDSTTQCHTPLLTQQQSDARCYQDDHMSSSSPQTLHTKYTYAVGLHIVYTFCHLKASIFGQC